MLQQEYLTDAQVGALFGRSRHWTWQRARRDADFPKPIKLAEATTRWRLSEIRAWADSKARVRESAE